MHPNARNNRNFEKIIKNRRNRVVRLRDRREKDKAVMRDAYQRKPNG